MRSLSYVGFVGFLFLSAGIAQATTVIDFEDWTGGSGEQFLIKSKGFVLGEILSVGPDIGTDNVTNTLHSGPRFKMGPESGSVWNGRFTLVSFDLQEGSAASQTRSIELVGYQGGGQQVFESIALDGLGSTYETLYPVGFSGLTGLICYAYTAQGDPSAGFSIDNIVIVPEPSSLGLGMLGLLAVRKRKPRL